MSVDLLFFSVDWQRVPELPRGAAMGRPLIDAAEDGEAWVRFVPFGEQIDDYFFTSYTWAAKFSGWFHQHKESMNPAFVAAFASVFSDIGLLFDKDDDAPVAIKLGGLDPGNEWVVAAIPPVEVADLSRRAGALDPGQAEREFQQVLDAGGETDFVPEGAMISAWIEALRDGLAATSAAGHGIIAGAG